jgi:hypothetical protein
MSAKPQPRLAPWLFYFCEDGGMAIVGKDARFRLVDYIENLYLENLILKDELRHRNLAQMAAMLEKLKADPRITTRVRALFAPLRARILEEAFEEQAIQEFLKANPPKNVH